LAKWLQHYNYERPHRGYRSKGKKHYETFTAGKKEIRKHKAKRDGRKEVKKAA